MGCTISIEQAGHLLGLLRHLTDDGGGDTVVSETTVNETVTGVGNDGSVDSVGDNRGVDSVSHNRGGVRGMMSHTVTGASEVGEGGEGNISLGGGKSQGEEGQAESLEIGEKYKNPLNDFPLVFEHKLQVLCLPSWC